MWYVIFVDAVFHECGSILVNTESCWSTLRAVGQHFDRDVLSVGLRACVVFPASCDRIVLFPW